MRKSLLTLICLAALAAPRPAPAYPDSSTPYTVDAGGVSLTLLRDSHDQRQWYYLPSSFTVAGTPAKKPEQFLLTVRVPPGDNLKETAVLLVALDLTLPPDVRQKAAAAVAALPVMNGLGTAADIKLDCVDLRDLKLTVFDEEGTLAEAAPDPALTSLPDPAHVAFTAVARDNAAGRLVNLMTVKGSVSLRLNYFYAAGPGPVFPEASAAGAAGFGDYTRERMDKAIFVLPPGPPDRVFLKLPQVSTAAGLAAVYYTFQVLGPDAGLLGIPATRVAWRDGVWQDPKQTEIYLVSLPLKDALDRGVKPESIVLRTDAEIRVKAGRTEKSEKAWAQAPLFSGDLPLGVAQPPSPFRPLTVSGDYVDFRGGDGLDKVVLAARCDSGREAESAVLNGNKEGTLVPEPVTFFFTDGCETLALKLTYVQKEGKVTNAQRAIAAGEEVVYLGNPE